MHKSSIFKPFFLFFACLLVTHYGHAMEEATKNKDETFRKTRRAIE